MATGPPTSTFSARTTNAAFDRPSFSDDEDEDDNQSTTSRSTWASTSDATILGFADGYVARGGIELLDWRMSRIGGEPSFPPLTIAPAHSSSLCLSCSKHMPLLTQIYCPIAGSNFERVVYIFGCPRSLCRGRKGSLRCWRADIPWPDEVEEVEAEDEKPKDTLLELGNLIFVSNGGAAAPRTTSSSGLSSPFFTSENPPTAVNFNPFAPHQNQSSSITPPSPFNPFLPSPPLAVDAITSQLSAASLGPSLIEPTEIPRRPPSPPAPHSWPSTLPSYPAQYLTTAYEPAAKNSADKFKNLVVEEDEETGGSAAREGKGAGGRVKKGASSASTGGTGSGESWGKEGYEVQKVRGVDEVFLRFQERVSREGSQVVRYDHLSTPLPFSASSPSYKLLFPSSATDDTTGIYDPRALPPCEHCSSRRTFELQLMPALVGLLNKLERTSGIHWDSDDANVNSKDQSKATEPKERTKLPDDGSLDWATVMVFTCREECTGWVVGKGEGEGEKEEAWREEVVFAEWEEQ